MTSVVLALCPWYLHVTRMWLECGPEVRVLSRSPGTHFNTSERLLGPQVSLLCSDLLKRPKENSYHVIIPGRVFLFPHWLQPN